MKKHVYFEDEGKTIQYVDVEKVWTLARLRSYATGVPSTFMPYEEGEGE